MNQNNIPNHQDRQSAQKTESKQYSAQAKNEKSKKERGSAKLPAGTPASSADGEGYGIRSTTDPAVPNRAHTEL